MSTFRSIESTVLKVCVVFVAMASVGVLGQTELDVRDVKEGGTEGKLLAIYACMRCGRLDDNED